MDKIDLIEKIRNGHTELERALGGLSPEQLENSFVPGEWTVKETLVHLSGWERTLIEDHARWKRGEPLTELQGQSGVDAFNAELLKAAGKMSLGQVLDEFHSSFRALTDWMEDLEPEDLSLPFMYGMSLEEFIAEDTYKHYGEHLYLIGRHQKK
ncbi:MAG: maleylpyruvate isomerase family protein [Chloroflexi bacterium]|nr:maleylpyruvate isomerase family protein [Chloroflexota bacterium]BCY17795.1 hypothetical protein hrd7_16440 [Leptolinea sp. HRD-7]